MKKLIYILALFFTFTGFSQNANIRKANFNLENQGAYKVAIQGYDPVGYFKQGKALKGRKEIPSTFEGVVYYFYSVANRDLFLKNPSEYEPQYGGWCAYAMGASGEKVEINPETFKIVDGKLYLFYNAFFNNTLKTWNKDESGLKKKANLSWKKIYN